MTSTGNENNVSATGASGADEAGSYSNHYVNSRIFISHNMTCVIAFAYFIFQL